MILYIDCSAGVSGDMALAAFLDMGLPLALVRRHLRHLFFSPVKFRLSRVTNRKFQATRFSIETEGKFPKSAHKILQRIAGSGLPDSLKKNLSRVWSRLALAEGATHRLPWRDVIFHQLARPDTMICFLGFCLGLDYFHVRDVRISSVPLGRWHENHSGFGSPTPGPAASRLLSRFPIERREDRFEWTTPTGAALLSAFARATPCAPFSVVRIGYGVGTRRSPRGEMALRFLLGREF